jgi:hypothetical protein
MRFASRRVSILLLALGGVACIQGGRAPLSGGVVEQKPGAGPDAGSPPLAGAGGSPPLAGVGGSPPLAGAAGGVTVVGGAGVGGAGGGPLFGAAVTYATAINASSIAIGDLDGDGALDLAVANYGDNQAMNGSVSVLLNRGNGTFAPATSFDVFASPQSIALADLDGDGRTDVIVSNTSGNDVITLRNTGKGTLGPPVSYAAGRYPQAVAASDMNGDGKPDVLVVSDAGTLNVLKNLGGGTLAGPVSYSTGGQASFLAVGDLNGDGKDDVAMSNSGNGGAPGNLGVRLNLGDGTLSGISSFGLDTPFYARSVAIGDMNGDGHPDLVVGGWWSSDQGIQGRVDVFSNDGKASFTAPASYAATSTEPVALVVADFDRDGAPDVAAASYQMTGQSAAILMRDTGVGLGPAVSYPAGTFAQAVAAGDLDRDGWIDLVIVDSSPGGVSVLLNTGGHAPRPEPAVGPPP